MIKIEFFLYRINRLLLSVSLRICMYETLSAYRVNYDSFENLLIFYKSLKIFVHKNLQSYRAIDVLSIIKLIPTRNVCADKNFAASILKCGSTPGGTLKRSSCGTEFRASPGMMFPAFEM